MNILPMKLVDVFDNRNKLLNRKELDELKIILSNYWSFIERNFRILFGTKDIDENIIKTDLFKNYYSYLSSKLTENELIEFFNCYYNYRNICMHSVTFIRKRNDLNLPPIKIFDNFIFLNEKSQYYIDNELTVHGLFTIMIMLMTNEQIHNFIDLIFGLKYINISKWIKDNNRDFRKGKVACKNKVMNLNQIIFDKKYSRDLTLFMSNQLINYLSNFFISFEHHIYKIYDIDMRLFYSTFEEALSQLDIDEVLKQKIISLRNKWAHGLYYIKDDKDNIMSEFIEVIKGLLYELGDDFKFKNYLNYYVGYLLNKWFVHKYKRLIELSIKSSKLYLPGNTSEKIIKLSKLNISKNFISDNDEKILFDYLFEKGIKFNFKNNQNIKGDIFIFEEIKVLELDIPDDYYFEINGEIYDFKKFIIADLEGVQLPKIKIYNKKLNIEINYGFELLYDYGFAKINKLLIN